MDNINNSWSQKKIIKYISENRKNYNDLYLGEKILLNLPVCAAVSVINSPPIV